MSEPISVGDLVMVVRQLGCACDIGHTFVVERIERSPTGRLSCGFCNHPPIYSQADALRQDGGWSALAALKRIPPLSELEGQPTQEDIKEPA